MVLFLLLLHNASLLSMRKIKLSAQKGTQEKDEIEQKDLMQKIDDPMEYGVIMSHFKIKELGPIRVTCKKYKQWVDKYTEFIDPDEYKTGIVKKILSFGYSFDNKKIKQLQERLEAKMATRDVITLVTKRRKKVRVNKHNLEQGLFSLFGDELHAMTRKLKKLDLHLPDRQYFVLAGIIMAHYVLSFYCNINPLYMPIGFVLSVLCEETFDQCKQRFNMPQDDMLDRFYEEELRREFGLRMGFRALLFPLVNIFCCGAMYAGCSFYAKKAKGCVLDKVYFYHRKKLKRDILSEKEKRE